MFHCSMDLSPSCLLSVVLDYPICGRTRTSAVRRSRDVPPCLAGHPVATPRTGQRSGEVAGCGVHAEDRGASDVSENRAGLAAVLHRARSGRTLLDAAREARELSLGEAYVVQDQLTELRLGEAAAASGGSWATPRR